MLCQLMTAIQPCSDLMDAETSATGSAGNADRVRLVEGRRSCGKRVVMGAVSRMTGRMGRAAEPAS